MGVSVLFLIMNCMWIHNYESPPLLAPCFHSPPTIKPFLFKGVFLLGVHTLFHCPCPPHQASMLQEVGLSQGFGPFLPSVLGSVLIWPFGSESAWAGSLRAAVLPPQPWLSPNLARLERRKRTERKPRQQGGRAENKDLKAKTAPSTRAAFTGLSGCWLHSWQQETTEGPSLFVQPHLCD